MRRRMTLLSPPSLAGSFMPLRGRVCRAEGLFDLFFGGGQSSRRGQAPPQANFFADPFGLNQPQPARAGAARRRLRTRLLRAQLRRQVFSG